VCAKNLSAVSLCAMSPVVHMSNISSCQKNFFQFSCGCEQFHSGRSFGFLVINIGNHGEHYEMPCICQNFNNFTQKAVWMRNMTLKAQVKHGDCSPYDPNNYVGCSAHFPVLVAMQSKPKVCSYLVDGIMGLSLAEDVDVHLLCLLCVV
jgi:hypothetical protein